MVMGPAGTGKSTYCKVIQEHCQNSRRSVHVVNLDPAAETFEYEVAFDIRGDGLLLYHVTCRVSVAGVTEGTFADGFSRSCHVFLLAKMSVWKASENYIHFQFRFCHLSESIMLLDLGRDQSHEGTPLLFTVSTLRSSPLHG